MLKIYELVLQLTSHKSVVYLICMLYKTLPSLLTCPLPFHDFSDSGEIALEKSERMVSQEELLYTRQTQKQLLGSLTIYGARSLSLLVQWQCYTKIKASGVSYYSSVCKDRGMIKFVHLSFRLSYQVHLLLEDAFEKKNKKTKGECSSIVYIYIYIYIYTFRKFRLIIIISNHKWEILKFVLLITKQILLIKMSDKKRNRKKMIFMLLPNLKLQMKNFAGDLRREFFFFVVYLLVIIC